MKVKKTKPNIKNNNGFTLIEVLLAIVILSLVSAPILRGFIVTANTSARARTIMEATDVAQLIVEEISAMSFDKEFTDTFLTADTKERIPAVGYNVDGEINTALNQPQFFSHVKTTAFDDKKCFINSQAGDTGYKLVALPNIEYDGKKYDVLIAYKSNATGSEQYYTYEMKVQVFDQDVSVDEDGNNTYTHYRNQLVELTTEISNKY